MDTFLSNNWWSWLVSNYTVTIGLVIGLIVTVLNVIAVIHPDDKTSTIVELLQGWIWGFPGVNNKEEKEIFKEESKGDV
jgi:hypothetical protein